MLIQLIKRIAAILAAPEPARCGRYGNVPQVIGRNTTNFRLLLATALLAGTASAAYVDFTGKLGDPTIGDLTNINNWPGGVLPSGSETGRVVQANNVWVGIAKDILVRLEGGRIGAVGGGIDMRGNALFEIDAGDWSSTTNLDVGGKTLTMWSQDGGTNELNILNGRVAAGDLNMVSPGKSTIHMGIGALDVGYWKACKGAIHMRAGGSGSFEVGTVNSNANFLADCSFNFETGNRGSITLGEIEGGGSAAGTWESLIAAGKVSIDAVAITAASAFSITNSGNSTTLQLAGVVEVADLWVPSIFANGMVLQSGQPVSVWGRGEPGETITVSFDGQVKDGVVGGDGRWSATLDSLAVSMTGATLSISASASLQSKTFTDVRVGEVWLLSGQSNMAFWLQESDGGSNAVAAADYPWLRIFNQTGYQSAQPVEDVTGGNWFTCEPGNAGTLSAVGFYFARELQASLPTNTPIALINSQWPGSWIENWIDAQTLSTIPAAQSYFTEYTNNPTGIKPPSQLYNGRIAPLQPFGIGGVVWYQGEGNTMATLDSVGYVDELKGLVTSWRQQWNDADLPFLVVQLPRYHAEDWSQWPEVRNAQAQAAHDMDGVELAVTLDLGEEFDIHPADKEPVGERLALLARAKVYGEAVDCYGPVFQSLEIDGSDALVEWANADGLVFSNGVAQGFEICGTDGVFVSAQAEILPDNRVRVYSAGVPSPVGVRYGWFNWGEVSLFNGLGLPAAPFQSRSPVRLKPVHNGNLYAATNWVGDVLPTETDGLVGLVDGTDAGPFSVPNVLYDFSLRQEDGMCTAAGELNLRGGATNETVTVPGKTLWTIDDQSNDPAFHTNLYVPSHLVIWSHMGGSIELNLLRGRIEVGGSFKMPAYGKGVLNIRDGVFRTQFFKAQSATINLMAGGAAEVDLGQMETDQRNVVFNFESGFNGSVTISKTETGAAFGAADWQALADAGKITMDGVPVGLDFLRVVNGGTTLQHISALPGLSVVGGTLYREGEPYRAAGMNYCDMFQSMIKFPEYAGQTEYRTMEGLQFLGEQGIPFVRFWACGFWPSDWDLYFSDKAEWFSRMDLLVATAEAANVGLIPSLFWRKSTYPELMGEYRDAWGDPGSLTRQFMTNYVHEVVGRYKDSPAIWGWEFGNEFNLGCDLPNWDNPDLWQYIPSLGVVGPATDYTSESNRLTYAIAESAFNAFSTEVRKLDAHRFICTGNSKPRNNSWNNRMNDSWTVDSYAEAKEAFGWMQPASIDMASVHVYPGTNGLADYAEASGMADILQRYREFCDDQDQALFVGEYSSFYDQTGDLDAQRATEAAMLDDLIASGADLLAHWVFDYTYNRTNAGIIRATNDYTWVLDKVREADATMRGEEALSLGGIPVDWFDQNGIAPTGSLTLAQVEQDINDNGMTAWEYYLIGFHPLDTQSVFAITGFELPAATPGLEWLGGTNGLMTAYEIQSSTNLLDVAAWQTIDTHAREEGTNTWTGTPTADPARYYRIAVPE